MIGRLLAALLALLPSAQASVRPPLEFLVPAYFYPNPNGSDWDRLITAALSGVPITAIVNPASGPGELPDASYRRVVTAFRAAGGRVLGYIPSGYAGERVQPSSSCKPSDGGTYSVDDLLACARRYRAFYAVDGMFIDEMGPPHARANEDETIAFYTRLYDGLKRIDASWHIAGNPGTIVSERFLRRGSDGGADVLITFEQRAEQFPSSMPAPYYERYPANRFGAILIETPPQFDVVATLAAVTRRNMTYVYATDDLLPNPYDRLPADFEQQVIALRAFNAARAR